MDELPSRQCRRMKGNGNIDAKNTGARGQHAIGALSLLHAGSTSMTIPVYLLAIYAV